jgi:hypothetical protein
LLSSVHLGLKALENEPERHHDLKEEIFGIHIGLVFEGFCPGTPCGWHAILDVTEVWSSGATNDGGVSTEAYYEIFGGNQNTIGTRSFRRVMTGTAFRGWDNFTISVFGPNACCFGQPFNPPPSTQLNYREPF